MVDPILAVCAKDGFAPPRTVTAVTVTFHEEIVHTTDTTNRKRLKKGKFGKEWVCAFVAGHAEKLSGKVSRSVDYIWYLSFNDFTVLNLFEQITIVHNSRKIIRPSQICNLDETGFTPGRNLDGVQKARVVTPSKLRDVTLRAEFSYNICISVLVAIFADGHGVLPAVVFKGGREPSLSNGIVPRQVSNDVPESWRAFWRKEVALFDFYLFVQWACALIPLARAQVNAGEWIVLLYDALRVHVTCEVINALHMNCIAVVAMPAHTSDRMQPLDVSVFGPFKSFANRTVQEITARQVLQS